MQEYQRINGRCLDVNRRNNVRKPHQPICYHCRAAAVFSLSSWDTWRTYMHSLLESSLITTTRAWHNGQFKNRLVIWKGDKKKTGRRRAGNSMKHRRNNNGIKNTNLVNSVCMGLRLYNICMSIRLTERRNVFVFIIRKEAIREYFLFAVNLFEIISALMFFNFQENYGTKNKPHGPH